MPAYVRGGNVYAPVRCGRSPLGERVAKLLWSQRHSSVGRADTPAGGDGRAITPTLRQNPWDALESRMFPSEIGHAECWGGERGAELLENKVASVQNELKQSSALLQAREEELLELQKQLETERSAAKIWEQEAQKQTQEETTAKVEASQARQREELASQREQQLYNRVLHGDVESRRGRRLYNKVLRKQRRTLKRKQFVRWMSCRSSI